MFLVELRGAGEGGLMIDVEKLREFSSIFLGLPVETQPPMTVTDKAGGEVQEKIFNF